MKIIIKYIQILNQRSIAMKNNGEKSRLKICVLTGTFFDSKMPARPAITEIFGNYLPLFGHKITWLVHSDKERIFNYNQVKVIGIKSSSSLLSYTF